MTDHKSYMQSMREQRLKDLRREFGREKEPESVPTEAEIKARYEGVTIEVSESLKQNIAARVG